MRETAGFSLKTVTQPPIAANANPATGTITGTDSDWNVEITGEFSSSSMQGSTGNKYWQMGKKDSPITSASFSTDDITGTITNIVVNCAAYNGNAQVSATVNGNAFGTQNQNAPSWSNNSGGDITFSGSAAGEIVVSLSATNSARAIYIQSITVTYTSSSGPEPDPNVVLDKTNSPFSSTSSSNTSVGTKTLDGIEYQNYGGYVYSNNYLSFNRNLEGAYLGNNTVLCGNIKKIVIDYNSGGASLFTMYEGASALAETTTVAPSSTGTGAVTYTFSGDNGYFKLKLTTTGTYCNINSISIYLKECNTPAVTVNPSSLSFAYVAGTPENELPIDNVTIDGNNLTQNVVVSLPSESDFELSEDLDIWGTSATLVPVNNSLTNVGIAVRLKEGKSIGSYNGSLSVNSSEIDEILVTLTGEVTTPTHTIEQYSSPATANGTITFDPVSPVPEGATVTMTATPNEGYEFTADSWDFYNASTLEQVTLTVTDGNKITMPAYNLAVDATFAAKTTYTITAVANPTAGGTIVTDDNAWEGKVVTVWVQANDGYAFSALTVTKTGDANTTVTVTGDATNGFTFTMPAYAVTATATFLSDTYEGTFAVYSGALTEGDYLMVYDGKAMNNDDATASNKLKYESVTIQSNTITNPSRNIVWHIAPSETEGYWTIYNAKSSKYVSGAASSTNLNLVTEATDWSTTGTYDFQSKANEGQTTTRYIRYYSSNDVFGNYASSNGGALTLYKYTVLTERTITFNGNGGTYNDATTYTQTVYDGVVTALNPNQFTKDNAAFAGWANTADGDVAYTDGANITVTGGNKALYAKWNQFYTATVDSHISGGSVLIDDGSVNGVSSISVVAGTTVSLIATPTSGYTFDMWNVYKEGDPTTTVSVTNNQFEMPAYNVVVSATFKQAVTYSLITSINNFVSGKHYIIASGANGSIKAMGTQNTNNRAAVTVSSANGVIPETTDVFEFVIIGPDVEGFYTIYDVTEEGYLYAASSGSNWLRNQEPNDNNGRWSIAIDNTGAATIVAQGSNTNKYMRFNNTLFSCYGAGSSVTALPYLYAKDGENPDQFSKNDIAGYGSSERGGYYLIASPVGQVTPAAGNGFLTNNYDLYAFDQSASNAEVWRNYEATNFNLVSGRGYLYANSGNTTKLTFEGMPYVGNGQVILSYDGDSDWAGWNLIGNPYATNATIPGNQSYYTLNTNRDELIAGESTTIGAMEGIFVKATAAGESVTFTPTIGNKGDTDLNSRVVLNLNGKHGVIDRAIVRFSEGGVLPKFMMNPENTRIYIRQDNEDFAVLNSNGQGEMPVNFKAAENGTYTISVEAENLDVEYLHLIDNITGMDVDLLATPSYTFEGKKTDYASRFRLVFDANAGNNEANEEFAFISDGDIIVNGTGTIQVIDILGRQMFSHEVNSAFRIQNSEFAPGVYVLRLINGNNVKTQKIVVK